MDSENLKEKSLFPSLEMDILELMYLRKRNKQLEYLLDLEIRRKVSLETTLKQLYDALGIKH
jgi:hypothetical protein